MTVTELVEEYLKIHQAAPSTIEKLCWLLSKATAVLAGLFMIIALALAILGQRGPGSIVSGAAPPPPARAPQVPATPPASAPVNTTAPTNPATPPKTPETPPK